MARLKDYDQKLAALDTTALSTQGFKDYRILKNSIKLELFQIEDSGPDQKPHDLRGQYDVSIYVKRDFAPIEDRVKSIIAIEKMHPIYLPQAKANLKDTLPKPYIETAIQIAQGTAAFLDGDLNVA